MKIGLTEARVQVSERESISWIGRARLHDCPRGPSRGRGGDRHRHVCFPFAPRRRFTKVDQSEDPITSRRIRTSSACF